MVFLLFFSDVLTTIDFPTSTDTSWTYERGQKNEFNGNEFIVNLLSPNELFSDWRYYEHN